MAIKKVIAVNSYRLKNCTLSSLIKAYELGHGCFLYSNGICGNASYSHSNREHNHVDTGFMFGAGEEILVETNDNKLIFMN